MDALNNHLLCRCRPGTECYVRTSLGPPSCPGQVKEVPDLPPASLLHPLCLMCISSSFDEKPLAATGKMEVPAQESPPKEGRGVRL